MESSIEVARGFERTHDVRRDTLGADGWRGAAISSAIILVLLTALALASQEPARPARGGTIPPWNSHLAEMDAALAARDVRGATRAWSVAYTMALGIESWRGMTAVGEAALRLGERTGHGEEAAKTARALYQMAFLRAQRQASAEGMLRAAEGFARVGDPAMADLALRVARSVAGDRADVRIRDDIRALQDRLTAARHPAATP